jgi:hypothetical protein
VIKIVKGRKYVTDFFNGFAAVCDTFPNITYIDRQGKKVFWIKDGAKYQKSMNGFREGQGIFKHQFKDGFAPIYQKDKDKNRYKWGFIDTNFKTVIPCKYDQVTPFSEDFAAVDSAGYWRFIDVDNTTIQAGAFLETKPCTEGVAWVRTVAGWGLLKIPPRIDIQWVSPRRTQQNVVTIICKSSNPIDSIQLKWDGKMQTIQINRSTCDTTLTIPLKIGKMAVKCTIWSGEKNGEALKYKSQAVYYYQPPPKGTPVPYSAVFIANKEYENPPDNTWESLKYPILQADTLGNILYDQYQFWLIEAYQNANLAQMDSILNDLKYHKGDDRVLLYYTGHGHQTEDGKTNYLIPVDAIAVDRKRQISGDKVIRYIDRCPSEHFLFIIDACFAGAFATASVQSAPSEQAFGTNGKEKGANTQAKERSESRLDASDLTETLASYRMMTGGHAVTVIDDNVFMRHLFITLLRNQAAKFSALDLYQTLKEPARRDSPKHVPQFESLRVNKKQTNTGGDFIFSKKQN